MNYFFKTSMMILMIISILPVNSYELPDNTDPKEDYYFFIESDYNNSQYLEFAYPFLLNFTLNSTINAIHLVDLEKIDASIFGSFEYGNIEWYTDNNGNPGIIGFNPEGKTEKYNLTWNLVFPLSSTSDWQLYAIERNGTEITYMKKNATVLSSFVGNTYKETWNFNSSEIINIDYRPTGVLQHVEYEIDGITIFRIISLSLHEFQYYGAGSPNENEDSSGNFWIGLLGGLGTVLLVAILVVWRRKG